MLPRHWWVNWCPTIRRTGGTTVRRIAPGDPTTKDYRIDRITVTIADNRVVAAACG